VIIPLNKVHGGRLSAADVFVVTRVTFFDLEREGISVEPENERAHAVADYSVNKLK